MISLVLSKDRQVTRLGDQEGVFPQKDPILSSAIRRMLRGVRVGKWRGVGGGPVDLSAAGDDLLGPDVPDVCQTLVLPPLSRAHL